MSNNMFYGMINVNNNFYKNKYKKIPAHIINLKSCYSEFQNKKRSHNSVKGEAQGILRIIYHENSTYIDEQDENIMKVKLNFLFEPMFNFLINPEVSIIIVEDPNSFNCNSTEDLMKKFNEIHKSTSPLIKFINIGRLKSPSIEIPSNINTNKSDNEEKKQKKKNYALFIQVKADNYSLISQPYTLMCPKQFSHTSDSRKNSFFKNILNDEDFENAYYYYNLIFECDVDDENECRFKQNFEYRIKFINIDRNLLFDNSNNKPTITKMINILNIFKNYNEHGNENHMLSNTSSQLSGNYYISKVI